MAADPGFDWADIRLVAFDVDGTLYRQRPLRLRMALALALRAGGAGGRRTLRVLSAYRRLREDYGEAERDDVEATLVAATAAAAGVSADEVTRTVAEWIHRRPLPHLRASMYAGLPGLFAAIRASGRTIGILSDYPAAAKLAAMGLAADHMHGPDTPDFTRLKPSPHGLLALIAAAGVAPHQTVLVGDRPERDGLAARRAGAHSLIRKSKPVAGWTCFARYDDPVFAPLLAGA
ncbi:HAD family hydrolase [Sphingomonas nostoxanthinifaciens]|uniref:HAD family hydrolase n=1 Tax=Sphingomonas nostoxanthinifaciens TaxID=2872652 RepID=UPI001CC1CC0F|nr:HAD family hydrolase [Sphingomonas nostoxanthinifaciens]UAK23418.1 HAD family hydrolase [Sphingomonas nostoxanthinifaciens]